MFNHLKGVHTINNRGTPSNREQCTPCKMHRDNTDWGLKVPGVMACVHPMSWGLQVPGEIACVHPTGWGFEQGEYPWRYYHPPLSTTMVLGGEALCLGLLNTIYHQS